MALVGVTGNVRETRGEVRVEWQIPDFFSLSKEIDNYYQSPVFCLPDSCWSLRIYPNGKKEFPDYVGLCVTREDSGPPKTVRLSLGIKTTDGVNEIPSTVTMSKNATMGRLKMMLSSELLKRRLQLAPSDVLTATCCLTSDVPRSTEVSLSNRLWNLSRNLKTMLDEKKGTDFGLKPVEGREMRAHRTILDARCNYFSGMLASNFQESSTGLAEIEDIEEDVLQCILSYLYTGEAEGVSDQNVRKVYAAAHKMMLVELNKLCAHYMKENLSVDLICDVIAIVEVYEEEELKERALDFFTEHAKEVFDSDGWRKFSQDNCPLVAKFLEKMYVWKRT